MKKIVFFEMEGVLAEYETFSPPKEKIQTLLKKLQEFSKENNIKIFLVSGFHKKIALKKFKESGLNKFFQQKNFLFVDEHYIGSKAEADREKHLEHLEKDPSFNDQYFKQVAIEKTLEENNAGKEDGVLFGNDLWLDGFYTMRFSKISFALLEENLKELRNPAEKISGLAYYSLSFESIKKIIKTFPKTDYTFLDKWIFEKMREKLFEGAKIFKGEKSDKAS